MAEDREPTDEEILQFMRPEARHTFEKADTAPQDRARIWQGTKKRWRAAHHPVTGSSQSPPPLEWSPEFKRRWIAERQTASNVFQQAINYPKPPGGAGRAGADNRKSASELPEKPKAREGRSTLRRLLEAFFAVVMEESVRTFIPRLLPYALVVILAGITWEVLHAPRIQRKWGPLYSSAVTRNPWRTRFVVFVISGTLLGLYWFAAHSILSKLREASAPTAVEIAKEVAKQLRQSTSETPTPLPSVRPSPPVLASPSPLAKTRNKHSKAFDQQRRERRALRDLNLKDRLD